MPVDSLSFEAFVGLSSLERMRLSKMSLSKPWLVIENDQTGRVAGTFVRLPWGHH